MEYNLVKLDTISDLPPGTQIAVKGFVKNLEPLLIFLLPVINPDGRYYYHHGVYLGNSQVINFHGENKADAKPRRCNVEEFRSRNEVDGKIYKVVYRNTATVLRAHDTLVRANKVLERPEKWPKFHIIYNNCETFATWLKTGQGFSVQVQDRLIYGLTSMTALGLLLLFLYNSQ